VLVAASGGADSTALALVTAAVAARGPWQVRLVTVDHGLRPCAVADADAVDSLSRWLGVSCDRRRVRVQPGSRLAARARAARYGEIEAAARESGATAVLMAHHAEDQLETVLMRLVRGAGAAAVGGIPATRRLRCGALLLRPWLERSREEGRALLARLGVPWREDPGNADRSRPRGRLRHEVLPLLEAMRGGAAVRASRTARRVRGAAAALRRRARGLLRGVGPWDRAGLRRASCEALALALRMRLGEVPETTVDRIVAAIRAREAEPRRFRVRGTSIVIRSREISIEA
jgi:tRNA(Ile)-lysidine synthase